MEGEESFGDDRDPLPLGEEVVSKEVEIRPERQTPQERWGLDGDWLWGGNQDTGRYRITEIKEGGKAEKAGLKVDDVV